MGNGYLNPHQMEEMHTLVERCRKRTATSKEIIEFIRRDFIFYNGHERTRLAVILDCLDQLDSRVEE